MRYYVAGRNSISVTFNTQKKSLYFPVTVHDKMKADTADVFPRYLKMHYANMEADHVFHLYHI